MAFTFYTWMIYMIEYLKNYNIPKLFSPSHDLVLEKFERNIPHKIKNPNSWIPYK